MEIRGRGVPLGKKSICIRFVYLVLFIVLFIYIMTILTSFYPPSDLWHLSHQRKVVQEVSATRI